MSHQPSTGLIVLSDCLNDSVAAGEISAHWFALTGQFPQLMPLPAALLPEEHIQTTAYASHALYRILRAATQHLGREGHTMGIAINGAPRDGQYPNGVPFCVFRHNGNVITAPFDPQVLRMVRREFGVKHVHLVDVEAVLRASPKWGEKLTEEDIRFITKEKFRSLWFQLRFTLWAMENRNMPSTWTEIPIPDDDDQLRISFVDGFDNGFLNKTTEELSLKPGDMVRLPRYRNGSLVEPLDVLCCTDFSALELGEPGLIIGYGYPMLVVGCGKAAKVFGYTHGQAIELRRLAPAASSNGRAH